MTDNRESPVAQTYDSRDSHSENFAQPITSQVQPSASPHPDPPAADPPTLTSSEGMVTVALPVDILAALTQHEEQSGQTPTQVILAALRSALGLSSPPSQSVAVSEPPLSTFDTSELPSATLLAEIESLKARLCQLETVMQRVEALEGKSIAF
ncbi:hypothetical protein [Thermocoleostomius sinensis]|uniref:Uncharacterized protein n=1 Tax=Thermocoleostomius sinensis A174 TaxID=2016057 RepID=A0A9E8ZL04_9CYAN|nr:hypothetical protein [Thermocoleostomius sinensis]WAL60431.1 hypothetical protein OXH18_00105 [Thermocoleostomius sinensis A174]